jgi:hypothetical protein
VLTYSSCTLFCLQALAAEKAAAAHEREMEVARLRALQEKVLDTRSQEDELRAKRYQVGFGQFCRMQHTNRCICHGMRHACNRLQDCLQYVHAAPHSAQSPPKVPEPGCIKSAARFC